MWTNYYLHLLAGWMVEVTRSPRLLDEYQSDCDDLQTSYLMLSTKISDTNLFKVLISGLLDEREGIATFLERVTED